MTSGAVTTTGGVDIRGCTRRRLEIEGIVGGTGFRPYVHGLAAALGLAGFEVLTHRHMPPNDGGLSLGQAVVAGAWVAAGDSAGRG